MIKIKDTSLAAVGTYFGIEQGTEKTQTENITEKSLKQLTNKYFSVPLTVEHDSKQIGWVDNLRVVRNMLIGDLTLYNEDDIKKCLNTYISPEFIITSDGEPVQMIAASIVENPAISDNLPILTENDLTVLNAKKRTTYRSQKNQKIEISDSDACEQCKKLAQKTRSKPITYAHAKSILPLHPNCRCSIKKM